MTASSRRNNARRGSVSVQVLVLLVPVLFGFAGFAVDLGLLYLARTELKTAANTMAVAAAQRLVLTAQSLDDATTASGLLVNDSSANGNRYYFGGLQIGQTNGFLNSTIVDPTFYATVSDAVGSDGASGAQADGTTAKHVKITLQAETPLLFWSFLSLALDRKVNVMTQAVAGISAPLCQACTTVLPLAVAAISADDTTDFGFVAATKYTFGMSCNGAQTRGPLPEGTRLINYMFLDRYNTSAQVLSDEATQLYRMGALGLPTLADQAMSCMRVSAVEALWANAAPLACNQNQVPTTVTNMMCGLYSRLDTTVPATCQNIAEVDTVSAISTVDTDLTDLDDYTAYTGNRRRILTIPIVDALSAGGNMTVLGFRQFLLEPDATTTTISAVTDPSARFNVLYLGAAAAPLPQGSIGGCTQTAGPGKVVLHQ